MHLGCFSFLDAGSISSEMLVCFIISICLCFVFRSMWSIIYFSRKQAVMIYCKLYTAFANIRPATRGYILQTSKNELDPHHRFEYWINILRMWWLKQYVLNLEFLLRRNWLGYISGTKHSFSREITWYCFLTKYLIIFNVYRWYDAAPSCQES